MRQSLAWLMMALLVVVQFVDIAVVDAAAITTPAVHSESDHDQGKAPLDGCEIHCGCHSLHHMAVCAAPGIEVKAALTGPALLRRDTRGNITAQSPPVPPPDA